MLDMSNKNPIHFVKTDQYEVDNTQVAKVCMCENHSKKWPRVGLAISTESANQRATFDHLASSMLTCYGDYI